MTTLKNQNPKLLIWAKRQPNSLSLTERERERERVREEERIKAIVVRGGVDVLSTIR